MSVTEVLVTVFGSVSTVLLAVVGYLLRSVQKSVDDLRDSNRRDIDSLAHRWEDEVGVLRDVHQSLITDSRNRDEAVQAMRIDVTRLDERLARIPSEESIAERVLRDLDSRVLRQLDQRTVQAVLLGMEQSRVVQTVEGLAQEVAAIRAALPQSGSSTKYEPPSAQA